MQPKSTGTSTSCSVSSCSTFSPNTHVPRAFRHHYGTAVAQLTQSLNGSHIYTKSRLTKNDLSLALPGTPVKGTAGSPASTTGAQDAAAAPLLLRAAAEEPDAQQTQASQTAAVSTAHFITKIPYVDESTEPGRPGGHEASESSAKRIPPAQNLVGDLPTARRRSQCVRLSWYIRVVLDIRPRTGLSCD